METDLKDRCRGMAPSEMMKKVSAINFLGLLGDNGDTDQEMREVADIDGAADADPTTHKNVHVISASEGEGSESGMQGGGSEPNNTDHANITPGSSVINSEKPFIIVDIESPPARTQLNAGVFTTIPTTGWPAQFTRKI
jgi:hypothetical protein